MARYLMFIMVVPLVVVACDGGTSTDPCEGITCSGHGACSVTNGEAICACDEGYGGDLCAECGEGYHDESGSCVVNEVCKADSCSGHGVCVSSTGVVACDCDDGYAGEQCADCATGYQDNDGDGACLPDCATSGLDCGINGICDDASGAAVCACDVGYTGDLCETCDTGYQDSDGDGTCLPDCSNYDCSGHGTCDDMSGTAVCTCDDGWDGPDCSVEVFGIEWLVIPGGTFMMGSDTGDADEQPVHEVTVPAFEMTITEVTVAQYRACVDAGVCDAPSQCGTYYNWDVAGRENHPVNCVEWQQAVDFCNWAGGQLPSESEWEYAARGGGQDITYPWGDDPASCTFAVMNDGGDGCGMDRTWSVCSKPEGNTEQGLCDMAGNAWELVQDWYHADYNGAPSDGSAWESPSGSERVTRGGGFINAYDYLRASYRIGKNPSGRNGSVGFRCIR